MMEQRIEKLEHELAETQIQLEAARRLNESMFAVGEPELREMLVIVKGENRDLAHQVLTLREQVRQLERNRVWGKKET